MIKNELKKNILDWKFFIGLLFSIYLVWFLGKEFNLDNFKKLLFEINLFYIFSALSVLIISVYFRAIRWKMLFDSKNDIGTKSLFEIQMIGYFGNNVLPLRIGEFIKSFIVSSISSLAFDNPPVSFPGFSFNSSLSCCCSCCCCCISC